MHSSSPALLRLGQQFIQAFYRAGHFFTPEHNGVTSQLPGLLQQHGLQNVQTSGHRLHYRACTPLGQHFAEDMKLVYRTIVPFFRKWTQMPEDYEEIYQQLLTEMQQTDFVATWELLTAWGTTR